MSGNGSLLNYWSVVQPKDAPKAPPGRPETQKAPRGEPPSTSVPQMPTPSSPLSSHSQSTPGGGGPVFGASPMTIRVAGPNSSTPRRASITSPVSIPSSPDSFPPTPIHTRVAQRAAKKSPPLPKAASTSFSSSRRSHADEIQDSDDDGFGSGSDVSDGSVESLRDAVRFSEPLRGLAPPLSSSSFSSLSAANASTARATAARAASSSSPNDSSSAAPSVTKRRAAAAVLTSPLPLRRAKQPRVGWQADPPPKHKFDMMALLRHAKQEDATDAAARRVSDILSGSKEKEGVRLQGSRNVSGEGKQALGSAPLLDGLLDNSGSLGLADGGAGSDDADGEGKAVLGSFNKDRLRKALDRTEVAAVSESWYFFKEYFVPSPVKHRPFPQKAAAPGSRWAFLRDATMRQDYFIMGVVRKAIAGARANNTGGSMGDGLSASQQTLREPHLTDELFLWILNEACVDPQPALRAEYADVLRCCPEQVRRFVDAERLLLLFQTLGPRWESIDLSIRLELVPTIHRPYPGRDWSPLRSLLRLVATLAESLSLEAASCAVKILLRMGIDRVVEGTPDILQDYQEAMRKLVGRVLPKDWSDFCYDTASSSCNSVQKPSLRWQVLACMPLDTPACHDMRRRLASAFFFNDSERARVDPRRQLQQVQGLTKLTVRDDLVLTPDTNFSDLMALVDMLGVFLDDVGRQSVVQLRAASSDKTKAGHDNKDSKDSKDSTAAAIARNFDADIDSLVQRLKMIGHGIESTGGGHIAQLDSKTAFERLQIRLTHSVRTRPPGRRSIFDRPLADNSGLGGGEDMQDVTGMQQKQQDIRNFFMQALSKKKAK
ncbi:hypothetical protein SCUCBS95973_008179 [Sporothrix curviconia]|uniref:Uncharacterized protein n=1 Tax=Sporothrix curviconia TaxID=1260050 RepID=A0ABP0CJA9_9PEZI